MLKRVIMHLKDNWDLKGRKGFTLVELLVVIAIIGVLATLVILNLGTARARARDTQRIAHLNQITGALEQYLEDKGTYPDQIYGNTEFESYFSGNSVPEDPRDDGNHTAGFAYTYTPLPNSTTAYGYQIQTHLELYAQALKSDADINASGQDVGTTGDPDDDCTGGATGNCIYERYVAP